MLDEVLVRLLTVFHVLFKAAADFADWDASTPDRKY